MKYDWEENVMIIFVLKLIVGRNDGYNKSNGFITESNYQNKLNKCTNIV